MCVIACIFYLLYAYNLYMFSIIFICDFVINNVFIGTTFSLDAEFFNAISNLQLNFLFYQFHNKNCMSLYLYRARYVQTRITTSLVHYIYIIYEKVIIFLFTRYQLNVYFFSIKKKKNIGFTSLFE